MSPLPRRARLGALLAPDDEAFSADGALVSGSVPGSMAEAAGVQPGDVILSVGGHPARSLCELSAALRAAGVRATVELRVRRGPDTHTHVVPVQHAPGEHIDDHHIAHGELAVEGARLRTVVAAPTSPRGTVLLLQGIACESIEAPSPLASLAHGWTRGGLRTIRVDKRGVGDSEGGPCSSLDFETELQDHRAALGLLLDHPGPHFLFGHSVGGMAAALLAAEVELDGVLVYGTSARTWLECIVDSTRRQLELRGLDPAAIEERVAALRARVLGDGLSGRCGGFHRQLDDLDLERAWSRVRASRVLIVRGEYDWVVDADEQAAIADLAPECDARVIDLPGLDHLLGRHESRERSLSHYGSGTFDDAIVGRTLEWMLVSNP